MAADDQFKHLRSNVSGRIPLASSMVESQIAINFADKKIYTKDDNGNVIEIGGSASAGGVDYVKDLKDVTLTPNDYLGGASARRLLSRIKRGKRLGVDADAIEYVSMVDTSQYLQTVEKSFIENKGYASTGTAFNNSELGLEVNPTSSTPSTIYLNQEGIGNPTTAGNVAATNSRILKDSVFVLRAKRKFGSTKVHQKYRFTFYGTSRGGGQAIQRTDFDFYSLPSEYYNYDVYNMPIPDGLFTVHRVEISKISGDAVSTNSADLVIQMLAIKSSDLSLGGLTNLEVQDFRDKTKHEQGVMPVDQIVTAADSLIPIAGNDGKKYFVKKADFSVMAGLTAGQKTNLGEAGIVQADVTNGRWIEVASDTELLNRIIVDKRLQTVWHYRSTGDIDKVSPETLLDLRDVTKTISSSADTFDSLTYYDNSWIARYDPIKEYVKLAAKYTASSDIGTKTTIIAGSQSGAGSPARVGSAYKIDVRKDTKLRLFFNNANTDEKLHGDGKSTLTILGLASSNNTSFKYNVKVVGKDTSGSPKTQDVVLEGIANTDHSWFSVAIDSTFAEINYTEWSDGGSNNSENLLLRSQAIVNPGAASGLPELGQSASKYTDPGEY